MEEAFKESSFFNSGNEIFYHVTYPENVAQILQEGLHTQIGPRSLSVEEDEPSVYLCREQDIPYWMILLGATEVLKIEGVARDTLNGFSYDTYKEFLSSQDIPAECVSAVKIEVDLEAAMKDLCKSYMYSLSVFVTQCAQYYNREPRSAGFFKQIERQANTLILNLPKINY